MTSILVVGGVYRERCLWPEWKRTFGSAGRAASALASLVDEVKVLTPAPAEVVEEYDREARLDGIVVQAAPPRPAVTFSYVHGMSTPDIQPRPSVLTLGEPFEAQASIVLRFGMLEATARVSAERCIYDPQSAFTPEPFGANGSKAARLAIVGNRSEIAALSGHEGATDGAKALLVEGTEVVVVKGGSRGALVVTKDNSIEIAARITKHVWPVGSGDVFAAAFAAAWGVQNSPAPEAAEFASFAVADYVETMSLPISPELRTGRPQRAPVRAQRKKVYLAGPFFSMSQRWLVDEAYDGLKQVGLDVFSPQHDVGRGPAEEVAPKDLAALPTCQAMFALLDGADSGTLFEVGYARALGIPVYGFAQAAPYDDLKMVVGSGCRVYSDFVTGLHHCAWGV